MNTKTKVCIICPIHGEFWQTPHHHLQGHKCKKCIDKLRLDNNFVNKSNIIHNNTNDYSKVKYINCETKVCIICPKHGEFWQTPHNHLKGQGCPICKQSKLEKDIFIFLREKY